jgi:hypothetical protein
VIAGKEWHSREIKLKESKCEEVHIALGGEIANRVACNHLWVKTLLFASVT